ncbi:hypothetical protein MMC20_000633 [Loxospora ochrophaea]|nr:hypothetical protein [Loxospora ochrophaea]
MSTADNANRPVMQHVVPATLADLSPRLDFTTSFLHFSPSVDGSAIQASAALLKPLIPTVLDLVYTNLLSYDITAKAFVPRQASHEGPVPVKPQDLDLNHSHIQRQKGFLRGYLLRIAGNEDWSPQSKLWEYMDKVAVAHTGLPGFVHRARMPELRVEYMHLGLLLGYVEDIVVGAVMAMEEIDEATKVGVIRAWSKVLWIQNDLFARKYVIDRDTGESPVIVEKPGWTILDPRTLGIAWLGVMVGVLSTTVYGTM